VLMLIPSLRVSRQRTVPTLHIRASAPTFSRSPGPWCAHRPDQHLSSSIPSSLPGCSLALALCLGCGEQRRVSCLRSLSDIIARRHKPGDAYRKRSQQSCSEQSSPHLWTTL
jgi:hypothetical protein